jgi:hypothetical protein
LDEPNGRVTAPAQLAYDDVTVIEDLADANGVETAGLVAGGAFFFVFGILGLCILERCSRGGVGI